MKKQHNYFIWAQPIPEEVDSGLWVKVTFKEFERFLLKVQDYTREPFTYEDIEDDILASNKVKIYCNGIWIAFSEERRIY